MSKAVTDTQYYNEIAYTIGIYGSGEKLKPSEMAGAISDIVHDAEIRGSLEGYADGYEDGIEQGRQAQYDEFWDALQNNGQRISYSEMFKNPRWTDAVFKPKHTMVGNSFYRCFMGNSSLTTIPVTIDCRNPTSTNGLTQTFRNMSNLTTIHNILCDDSETIVWDATFENDAKLANVTFDENSVIGSSISFANSLKLTSDSVDSIVGALKKLEDGEAAKTLTLHATVKANMTPTQTATIQEKGWTLA